MLSSRIDTERLVAQALLEDMQQDLQILQENIKDTEVADQLGELQEALSDTDWVRMGGVMGILWYKFDNMIRLLEKMASSNEDIRKALERIHK